jgi:hypothetical protein
MATAVNTSTQQYFGFDPRTIPECILWLDATDPAGNGVVPANGSSVTTWVDKARTPNNMTATGTVTYQDNPPRLVMSNSSMSATLSYGANTLFIVYNQTGTSGPVFTTNNLDVTGLFPNENGTTFVARSDSAWIGPPFPTSTLPRNTINLISVQYAGTASGSAMNLWLNGVLNLSSTTSGTITRNRLTLAVRSLNNQFMAGNYHEVILYNSSLTIRERQQVEGYLAWKWGFQMNIPASHPYKYNPPTMRVFQPSDVDGLQVWLDAADRSVFTLSGSNVTQWRDKSGNDRHFNPFNSTRTPFLHNGFNGRPTVESPAAPNIPTVLNSPTIASSNIQGATGFSFFMVSRVVSGVVFVQYELPRIISLEGSNRFDYGQSNVVYNYPAGFTNTSNNILNLNHTSSTSTIALSYNGSLLSNYSVNNVTSQYSGIIGIFGRPAPFGDLPAFGQISEFIIYNRSLLLSERQRIEGYLTDKWRVAALPTTHPYFDQRVLPSTPIFSPTAAPGLQVWLDSADPTALTLSGSNVTQWRDKSGNNRHGTPPATSNQPTYNGNGILFSAGGVQYLPLANVSGMLTNVAFNIFVVERNEGTYPQASGEGFFLASETPGDNQAPVFGYQTTTQLVFATWGAGTDLIVSNLPSSTTTRLWSFNMPQTSNRNINLNGTLVATHTNSTKLSGMPNLSVGRAVGGNYYRGRIYEILIYTTELSQFNRQRVEAYLAWKWGLQTLLPNISGFVPSQASGLALWLDAADATTISTTGTTVTQWRDKSGNNRHLGVGSGTTTYTSNFIQLNNSFMSVTSNVNLQNFTLFVVCEAATPVVGNQIIISARPNSGNDYSSTDAFGFYVDAAQIRLYGTLNAGQSITNALDPSVRFMTSYTGVSAGGLTSFQNGKAAGTAATSARGTTARGFAVGASWNGSTHTDIRSTARIYEILVYTRALTINERQQAEGYLAAKWGVPLSAFVVPYPFSGLRP